MERFLPYIKDQKVKIVISSLSVLIFLLAQLSQPFLVGKAIDSALSNDWNAFYICILITAILSLFGAVADFFFEYLVNKLTQIVICKMRDDVYKKYNSVSIQYLHDNSIGDLLARSINDIENVANGMIAIFKSLIEGILSVIITIIMMFTVNWLLALAVLVMTPISLFVSRFVAKFSQKHFKAQAKLQAELNAISLEAIDNIQLLQSLNGEDDSLKAFSTQDEKLRKEGKIAQFSASWTNPVTRLVNNFIYAIIGIAGIVMIGLSSTYPFLAMSIGRLSSFLSYTTSYSKPFNEISSVVSEYEQALSSFKRIDQLLEVEDDIDEGKDSVDEIKEIRFEDVSFSYQKDKKLITDFSTVIKRGEKVAIVGPTGAGKSTLINLLLRFYDIDSGSITINGKDYRSLSKDDLRSHFGMVLQDTWMFEGSIKDNVRYSRSDASDEEVINACKLSNASSFINCLPNGYDTIIYSNGSLSEGERQMLSIARVMLLNPEIVILDEATSNVDTRTEKLISEAFDKLLEGKTSIVIAHRLSTIRNADKILVLKDGDVIEQGNHKQLMKMKGFYYSMYSSQFENDE